MELRLAPGGVAPRLRTVANSLKTTRVTIGRARSCRSVEDSETRAQFDGARHCGRSGEEQETKNQPDKAKEEFKEGDEPSSCQTSTPRSASPANRSIVSARNANGQSLHPRRGPLAHRLPRMGPLRQRPSARRRLSLSEGQLVGPVQSKRPQGRLSDLWPAHLPGQSPPYAGVLRTPPGADSDDAVRDHAASEFARFFGSPNQFSIRNSSLSFDLFHGDAAFSPSTGTSS